MSSTNDDEYIDNNHSHSGIFNRALSPCSFERLRTEHSEYFYKPKRGPSTSKSNKTITRPIKTIETVTKLVELVSKGNHNVKNSVNDAPPSTTLTQKVDEQRSSSHYSSLLSIDAVDFSSHTSSSKFSSRSNSSISTVPEQESQIFTIDEPSLEQTQLNQLSCLDEKSNMIMNETNELYPLSSYSTPAIGINITTKHIHLVLLELYPQNVGYSIILFQRYLISLIIDNEHEDLSILTVKLRTLTEQEANFRLFTLTYDEFDRLLTHLQTFSMYNSSISSSFMLNIRLTGEKTNEFEMKISKYLSRINLNFDIVQYRIESYIIGLEFLLVNNQTKTTDKDNQLIEILNNHSFHIEQQLYPYIILNADRTSTIFYIVHSQSKYSVLTTNNLCYKTFINLIQFLQPGFDLNTDEEKISSSSCSIRRPPPLSFDKTHQTLFQNYPHSSILYPLQIPISSFTCVPQRYFPTDYSRSTTTNYIYRGWSNRHTSTHDENSISYDVHTQTDDSFLELSTSQIRLAVHRSLLSMFSMNLALIIKLIFKIYPSVYHLMLIGEYFQTEEHAAEDLKLFISSTLGHHTPHIYKLKCESLVSAIGCALPRVYFDVNDEEGILIENDSINKIF